MNLSLLHQISSVANIFSQQAHYQYSDEIFASLAALALTSRPLCRLVAVANYSVESQKQQTSQQHKHQYCCRHSSNLLSPNIFQLRNSNEYQIRSKLKIASLSAIVLLGCETLIVPRIVLPS